MLCYEATTKPPWYSTKKDLNLKFMYDKDTINNVKEQITNWIENI